MQFDGRIRIRRCSRANAKNAVSHMLSGKAIARAIRGHFLVDGALNAMLVCDTFNLPLPFNADINPDENDELQAEPRSDIDLDLVKVLYEELTKNREMANQVSSAEVLGSVAKEIEDKKVSMAGHRTAVLWMHI